MTVAQGTAKKVAVYKQTGIGVPRSGTGAQLLRRETSMIKLAVASNENNEITSHQQSTGKTHGGRSATFALTGLLSPSTYGTVLESLLRKAFATTTAITAASITVAGAGPFTLTDAGNTFLTKGVKIGDVIRITAGTYANAVNRDNNLLVTAVTETVVTVKTVNGTVLLAEGPIASSTITIMGKKLITASTSQTSDYWTVEEFQSDITQSELCTDTVWSSADISVPASGNATIALNAIALDRSSSGAQVLTTPTAETTTSVVQGIHGLVLVNGTEYGSITGATLKIDDGVTAMGNVLGTDVGPDVNRGVVKVSGQITAFYETGVFSGLFDAATKIGLVLVVAVDDTNASQFITFSMSKVTFDGDDKDDGLKGVIRTYPFTAELNGAGGAILANDYTILSVQDSCM